MERLATVPTAFGVARYLGPVRYSWRISGCQSAVDAYRLMRIFEDAGRQVPAEPPTHLVMCVQRLLDL